MSNRTFNVIVVALAIGSLLWLTGAIKFGGDASPVGSPADSGVAASVPDVVPDVVIEIPAIPALATMPVVDKTVMVSPTPFSTPIPEEVVVEDLLSQSAAGVALMTPSVTPVEPIVFTYKDQEITEQEAQNVIQAYVEQHNLVTSGYEDEATKWHAEVIGGDVAEAVKWAEDVFGPPTFTYRGAVVLPEQVNTLIAGLIPNAQSWEIGAAKLWVENSNDGRIEGVGEWAAKNLVSRNPPVTYSTPMPAFPASSNAIPTPKPQGLPYGASAQYLSGGEWVAEVQAYGKVWSFLGSFSYQLPGDERVRAVLEWARNVNGTCQAGLASEDLRCASLQDMEQFACDTWQLCK